MTHDQFGRVLSSGFLPNQVGSLTRSVEPVHPHDTLDHLRAVFAAAPELHCLPVETDPGLYRILDRRRVAHTHRGMLARLSGGGSIRPLLSSSFGVLDARQSVERALHQILAEQREPYQHHLVFHRGRLFGVVQLAQLVRHAFGQREEELNRAHSIQQHLVHRGDWTPPDYRAEILLDLAFELGGDFYHRQVLTPQRDLVACFDVSGKNISAALSTSLVSSFFATLEIDGGFSRFTAPELLQRLNTVLVRQTPPDLFVAGLMVFYDRAVQELEVYNLGYSPLYVISPAGEAEVFQPDFPPLGIEEQLLDHLVPRRIPRRPALRLFSASDGLEDAQNRDGVIYGEKQVHASLRRHAGAGLPGQEFLAALHQDVRDFVGDAPRTDDITMIALDF